MRAILLALLCALALSACLGDAAPEMAPIVRGEVIDPGAGRWTLSQQQLNGCIEWLTSHKDWSKLRALSPSPVQSIVFSHGDGARTQLDLFTGRSGWGNMLMIRSFDKDGKLQYNAIDELSEKDITSLKANLSKPQ